MELTLINWILALLPVLTVLVLMVGFGWGGSKAGSAAFVVALVLALLVFGGDLLLVAVAVGLPVAVAVGVYRYAIDRYSWSSQSSQFLESKALYWGSVSWHYAILLKVVQGLHLGKS